MKKYLVTAVDFDGETLIIYGGEHLLEATSMLEGDYDDYKLYKLV